MINNKIADRYAKSLIDTAVEKKQLEFVERDMHYLKALCQLSHDFLFLLKNPLIPNNKKILGVYALCTGKVSELTIVFLRLLITKNRENFLQDIINAFFKRNDEIKKLHKVKLTTAVPVSERIRDLFINKIRSETKLEKVELELFVKDDLIGGFILEYDNKLVDASLRRGINNLKTQFEKARMVTGSINLMDFEELKVN